MNAKLSDRSIIYLICMFDISSLHSLKEGSRKAFDDMFRHFYPRMMSYVATLVEQEVAEDIVQDVFLNIWENRKKIYVGEGFHSYLFQSAYTRCVDHYRKTQSAGKNKLQVEAMGWEEYAGLLRSDPSVLEEIYSKDFYEQLHNLLEQLPAQRREVFVLTYIEGLKSKEVADRLQMPQRTVESHIYLAIKFLKARMSKQDFYLFTLLFYFRQGNF